MKTVVFFTERELPPLEQVGGKALGLMQMTAAGLPVPAGLVLSVDFFQPWMETLRASPAWEKIEPGTGLGEAARALQALCSRLALSERQKSELENALALLQQHNPTRLYAVRSSSPEEDLEGASFAGGYETTLGVTADGIEAAIRHSFTSSFNERVFLYKKEHGFSLDRPRMAVIIQQQLEAASAGVAFSINPLNNCYDEALINANYGLGESVVSGEADPDLFVVDRLRGEILEWRAGNKQVIVTLDAAGGIAKSAPPHPHETAITPAQALEVTRWLEKVEACCRQPVDIEWAFANGKFYLLQVRPITTYLPLPPEMLTPPGQPKRLYANSTLIEQGLQEPLSVLGTDFLGYVLGKVGGAVAEGAVGPDRVTFTAGGGYYMNISYALRMGMKNAALAPGSFGDPRVMEILAAIDMDQYLGGELPRALKSQRGKMIFKMLPMIKAVLEAYLRPEPILRRYQAALPEAIHRLGAFSAEGKSLQAQAIALTDLLRFFYGDYGIPMILAGQMAYQRIKGLFKPETAQVQEHLINLGIALPGNKTTEMGEAMYALAATPEIGQYATGSEFLAALEQGSLALELVSRWKQFVAEFGSRCPAEIDPATPRPHENLAQLFEQIKNMSLAVNASRSFFDEARSKREFAYQCLHQLALKKGQRTARALEKYYKIWLSFGGYRETPKHYVIQVVDLFRRQSLAIAQGLAAAGRLDRPEQIFELIIADIDRALSDPSLDLRALARERTALIHKIRKSRLVVRVIDSRGKIYYPSCPSGAARVLMGVPISPGVVQGRVKILHYASEKKLLPGEILVARATDPGWTPLFINARGILLEIGGALQHGAVVAREYGIPCVSGLDEATTRLKDGDRVEVDGSNGLVRLLESQEEGLQPGGEG